MVSPWSWWRGRNQMRCQYRAPAPCSCLLPANNTYYTELYILYLNIHMYTITYRHVHITDNNYCDYCFMILCWWWSWKKQKVKERTENVYKLNAFLDTLLLCYALHLELTTVSPGHVDTWLHPAPDKDKAKRWPGHKPSTAHNREILIATGTLSITPSLKLAYVSIIKPSSAMFYVINNQSIAAG